MRFLKLRKSEKSISDLEGFADICNATETFTVCAAGCSGAPVGKVGGPKKIDYGFFGMTAGEVTAPYHPEYKSRERDSAIISDYSNFLNNAPGRH